MSGTELYIVKKNGDIGLVEVFGNSYRGAPLIWSSIAKRYWGMSYSQYSSMNLAIIDKEKNKARRKKFWKLAYCDFVDIEDRIVLMATYDWAIIRWENIPRYLCAVKRYFPKYETGHLFDQYIFIKRLYKNKRYKDIIGICWNQTSVNGDMWCDQQDGEDNYRSYNIFKDSNHWFVFDHIEKNHDIIDVEKQKELERESNEFYNEYYRSGFK